MVTVCFEVRAEVCFEVRAEAFLFYCFPFLSLSRPCPFSLLSLSLPFPSLSCHPNTSCTCDLYASECTGVSPIQNLYLGGGQGGGAPHYQKPAHFSLNSNCRNLIGHLA